MRPVGDRLSADRIRDSPVVSRRTRDSPTEPDEPATS